MTSLNEVRLEEKKGRNVQEELITAGGVSANNKNEKLGLGKLIQKHILLIETKSKDVSNANWILRVVISNYLKP